MTSTVGPTPLHRTATAVILAGCLIALFGLGARSVTGLFLDPMTVANGWSRETFGLAMAIQNLIWGLAAPFAGALADKFGPARVLAIGCRPVCGRALRHGGLREWFGPPL